MSEPIQLSIGGEATALQPWLRSLEYSESLDALDTVVAEFELDNLADLKTVLAKVKAGAPYSVTLGSRKLVGDVVRIGVSSTTGGRWQVTAVGLENLHRLRHQRLSEVSEVSSDKIAAQIIQKAGLTAKAQAVGATATETIFLDDPMLGTLKRLADEHNYALRANGKELSFSPRNAPAPGAALSLTWTEDLFGVDLHHDLNEVVTSVKVFGRDFRKGVETVEYEAKEMDLKKISGGTSAASVRKDIGESAVIVNETVLRGSASEVKARGVALLQAAAERFATARLRCALLLDAAVGQKVQLKGVPWPLGGPFLIHALTHVLMPAAARETRLEVFSDGLPRP